MAPAGYRVSAERAHRAITCVQASRVLTNERSELPFAELAHDVDDELDVSLGRPPVHDRWTEHRHAAVACRAHVDASVREHRAPDARVELIESVRRDALRP